MLISKWVFGKENLLKLSKKEIKLFKEYIQEFNFEKHEIRKWIRYWNYGKIDKLRRSILYVKKAISDLDHIEENEELLRKKIEKLAQGQEDREELFKLHSVMHKLHINLENQQKFIARHQTDSEIIKHQDELNRLLAEQADLLFGPIGEKGLLEDLVGKKGKVVNIKKDFLGKVEGILEVFDAHLKPVVRNGRLTPFAKKGDVMLNPISKKPIQGKFIVNQELRPFINSRDNFKAIFKRYNQVFKKRINAAVEKFERENNISDYNSALRELIKRYKRMDILKTRKNALLLTAIRLKYKIDTAEPSLRKTVKNRVNKFIFEVPDSRKRLRIGITPEDYKNQRKTVDYLLNEYDLYQEFLQAHKGLWNSFLRFYGQQRVKRDKLVNIMTNMTAFGISNALFQRLLMGKELNYEDLLMVMSTGLFWAITTPFTHRVIDAIQPKYDYGAVEQKIRREVGRVFWGRLTQLPNQFIYFCILFIKNNSRSDLMEFLKRGLAESAKDSGIGWMGYNPVGIGVGYVAQKIDLKYRYLFASSFNIVFGIFGEYISRV